MQITLYTFQKHVLTYLVAFQPRISSLYDVRIMVSTRKMKKASIDDVEEKGKETTLGPYAQQYRPGSTMRIGILREMRSFTIDQGPVSKKREQPSCNQ